MKKFFVLLVASLIIVSITGLAVAQDIDTKIAKHKAYLNVLQKKLNVAKVKKQFARVAVLRKQIIVQKAILAKLQAEKALEAPVVQPEAIPEAPAVAPAPKPLAPPAVAPAPTPPAAPKVAPAPAPVEKPLGVAFWGRGGLIAGILGAMGEVSYGVSNVLDWDLLKGVDVSAGGIYVQGKGANNVDRKVAALTLGGYIDVSQYLAIADPWGAYAGGGLNLPVKGGGATGKIGGQIFVGGLYKFDVNNSAFGEAGYTILRSDKYSEKSFQATAGYRYFM